MLLKEETATAVSFFSPFHIFYGSLTEKVIDTPIPVHYNGFVGNSAKIANISCGILRYMILMFHVTHKSKARSASPGAACFLSSTQPSK